MWKDSETELDFLDFDYLIDVLRDTISDDKLLPASIGVYGDWGSGKSSLMYMCKRRLEEADKEAKCLVFNGWLFEGYDDAKSAIMGSILDAIEEERTLTEKAKAIIKGLYTSIDKFKLLRNGLKYGTDFFLTGGLGTLADITLKTVVQKGSNKAEGIKVDDIKTRITDELNNKVLRNDIKKFQKKFSELLDESNISRLVIFIDELDRCSPDTILDTLEAMRLFLFSGKIAFVIGADERHIAYAVRKKFVEIEGIQIDIGKEYLEKLIQYPIRIPRLNADEVEFYITCLLLQEELLPDKFDEIVRLLNREKHKDFLKFSIDQAMQKSTLKNNSKAMECVIVAKQLASVLARGLNGNPRQCKRFLNSLDMRLKMAKYKGKQLDRKVLAKIMMLEYIMPSLFKKMAEMSSKGTLGLELATFEENNLDELNKLKIWKDDIWVQTWCNIEPKLANEDLTLYFYFTRTSLDEKVNLMSSKLSPLAQKICDELLSKSNLAIKNAISSADSVSETEAAKILEMVYNSMMSDTKLEDSKFKALLSWGSSIESLFSETLSYLHNLNGNQIGMGLVPYVCNFQKKSKKIADIKEISDKWIREKPVLEKAFQKGLLR
ncbi:KAP family P-loop NTPase fold protein [Clostridium akagii]|uniref:KAP family P-loop NTPase fold protein n=1 Tax=Clostridium akagii TaxID=91623 RepID=UPI00047ADE01|nr:P-loop NTPase fold protein [Clostridium akagii]